MPKGIKKLEEELEDAEKILEHHDYHRRVGDLRKLPSVSELEARIARLKAAIAKKSGGTRRRHRGTRRTRRHH
jgi:uncharacterized small protein (DUF1192 family)